MVMLVSPQASLWFHHVAQPSGLLGAAVMLHADKDGYLVRHGKSRRRWQDWTRGIHSKRWLDNMPRSLRAMRHPMPPYSHEGHADFSQPMAPKEYFRPGETP